MRIGHRNGLKTKSHIKRCAVFVDIDDMQPTFLNTENPELIDHLYDITQDRQFTSFSFIENNIRYWCVKSPLYFSEIYDDPNGIESLDGNTVDRSAEMAKLAENQLLYDASVEMLKKKLGMLKYAIGEGGGGR